MPNSCFWPVKEKPIALTLISRLFNLNMGIRSDDIDFDVDNDYEDKYSLI